MGRFFAVAVALAGCGRIDFDAWNGATGDASDARAIDAPVFALDAGECPPTYTFSGASCYRVVVAGTPQTWIAAEMLCQADALGAHLVVIDNMAEMMVVDGIVPGTIVDHWIGATDLVTEGTFLTVTNMPLAYTNWNGGAPNGGTAENCVVFNDDTTIHDMDCANQDDYVCEYDAIAAVPSSWGN